MRVGFSWAVAMLFVVNNGYAASVNVGVSYVGRDLNILIPSSDPAYGTVDGNNAGTISDQYSFRPSIAIHTKEKYFGSTKLGWYFNANLGTTTLSKQAANGDSFGSAFNRGTRIDSKFIYLAPMIFVRAGPDSVEDEPDRFAITFGAGYGISYVTMSGNMILNGQSPYNTISINERRSAKTYSFFLGSDYKHWFLNLSVTVMDFPMSSSPNYDYDFFDSSLTLGRRFSF